MRLVLWKDAAGLFKSTGNRQPQKNASWANFCKGLQQAITAVSTKKWETAEFTTISRRSPAPRNGSLIAPIAVSPSPLFVPRLRDTFVSNSGQINRLSSSGHFAVANYCRFDKFMAKAGCRA
jgi:hypothetical protein